MKYRMLPRMLAAMMAALFLIPTSAFAAKAPEVLFYDNFEGYGVKRFLAYESGNGWSGDTFFKEGYWNTDRRNYHLLEQNPCGEGKALKLGCSPGVGGNNGYLFKTLSMKDALTIRFQIMIPDFNGKRRVALRKGTTVYDMLVIDGSVAMDGKGRKLATIKQNVCYDIAVVVDKNGRYNIYLNEKRLTGRGAFLDIQPSGKVDICFGISTADDTDCFVDVFLDEIVICDGYQALNQAQAAKLETISYYNEADDINYFLSEESTRKSIYDRISNLVVFPFSLSKAYVNGEETLAPAAQSSAGKYLLPAVFTAQSVGGTVFESEEDTQINGRWGNITVTRDGRILSNGADTGIYTEMKDNVVLASAEEYAALLKKSFSTGGIYFGVISEEANGFQNEDEEFIMAVVRELFYQPPTKEQVMKDFYEKSPSHPRLMAEPGTFERILALAKEDAVYGGWVDSIIKKAETYLGNEYVKFYLTDGIRFLTEARAAQARYPVFAMAYNLTGDKRFSERAIEEILNFATFPGWHTAHALDTAESTYAVCLAYDWLYDQMTEEQRNIVETAIYDFSLRPYLEAYRDPTTKWNMASHWSRDTSNWNSVNNAGAILAALTLFEKHPDECAEVVAAAYSSYRYSLPEFLPDGGYIEGLAYWDYYMRTFVVTLAASDTALGTNYGYDHAPGIVDTMEFPISLTAANAFGFHDSRNTPMDTKQSMYFAQKLDKPGVGGVRYRDLQAGKHKPTILDILYYTPEFSNAEALNLPLDRYFRQVETGSLRSSWTDDAPAVVFFHGGESLVSHSQMDSGSFEMEMQGQRWVWDLGTDEATYVDTGEGYGRYDLYRYRPEGNNCLVINPSLASGQERDSYSFVSKFETKPRGSFAVMNLTDPYRNFADYYQRGYMLTNDRKSIVIQDDVVAKEPSEFFWSIQTRATIDIQEDGKSALLTVNGTTIRASLQSNANVKFETMPAEPLPTSPVFKTQAENVNINKLVVWAKGVKELNISVTFSPIEFDGSSYQKELIPLTEWSIPDGDLPKGALKRVWVDGEPYGELFEDRMEYTIFTKNGVLPNITADIPEGYTAEEFWMGNQKILILTDASGAKQTYVFRVKEDMNIALDDAKKLTIQKAEASENPEKAHSAENTIDGNMDAESRWSAEGNQWLKLDLGQVEKIDYAGLAFWKGTERISIFEMYVSDDGENWTFVSQFENSGQTDEMEMYRVYNTKGRYVRFDFHGNSGSVWNSVIEAAMYAVSEGGETK